MDRRSLTRLRFGFTMVGLLLLLPLFLLLRSAEARFEEQRRLRHEIVAERIFDEMERELTTLLATERQRPSSAYDAPHTRVATWAPFVVGYFKIERGNVSMIAREQLPKERAARADRAVATLLRTPGFPARAPLETEGFDDRPSEERDLDREQDAAQEADSAAEEKKTRAAKGSRPARRRSDKHRPKRKPSGSVRKEMAAPAQAPRPDTVLRQLNRGAEERQKQRKRSAPAASSAVNDDPLMGL